MEVKAVLRIAYSNQENVYIFYLSLTFVGLAKHYADLISGWKKNWKGQFIQVWMKKTEKEAKTGTLANMNV